MSGGLFFGINIGLKGLMAQQTGLNVTSHNVANANTPGYTRQRAHMVTSIPISGIGKGQLGSGVEIGEIQRMRDEFLDYQVRQESSKGGTWSIISDTLSQIETVFLEPSEDGFNNLMGEFWAAWQELSKFAESSPIRTTLKETAVTLTDNINHMYRQLKDLQNDLEKHIDLKIMEVNSIATQISDLNVQIKNIKLSGDNPNDLLDDRDILLDQLAKLVNIDVEYVENDGQYTGEIKVKIGNGFTLVDENGVHNKIEKNNDGTFCVKNGEDQEIVNDENDNILVFDTGEIAGLIQSVGVEGESDAKSVQYYLDKLDQFAIGLAKAVNKIHSTGQSLGDDSDNENFFIFDGEENAANIRVNREIIEDVSKIRAGATGTGAGNGDVAREIAQLEDTLLVYDEDEGLSLPENNEVGSIKIGDFYKNMISDLGVATKESTRLAENQGALVNQLEMRRESISGVSIDEEITNLIRYQHAYTANARVITTMDKLLETVVNLIR